MGKLRFGEAKGLDQNQSLREALTEPQTSVCTHMHIRVYMGVHMYMFAFTFICMYIGYVYIKYVTVT